ncbi:MAG: response regulator, partial [Acidobacteriota bacterium]
MHSCKNEKTILIGEEEPDVRRSLDITLRSLGYAVQFARNAEGLLAALRDTDVEISAVLLGLAAPDRGGLDVLREIRAFDANLSVIVLSGFASTADAVAAMKSGATDFLCKPVTRDDLARVLTALPETSHVALRPALRSIGAPRIFEGASPRSRETRIRVKQAGWSGVPVVIQGETG